MTKRVFEIPSEVLAIIIKFWLVSRFHTQSITTMKKNYRV